MCISMGIYKFTLFQDQGWRCLLVLVCRLRWSIMHSMVTRIVLLLMLLPPGYMSSIYDTCACYQRGVHKPTSSIYVQLPVLVTNEVCTRPSPNIH